MPEFNPDKMEAGAWRWREAFYYPMKPNPYTVTKPEPMPTWEEMERRAEEATKAWGKPEVEGALYRTRESFQKYLEETGWSYTGMYGVLKVYEVYGYPYVVWASTTDPNVWVNRRTPDGGFETLFEGSGVFGFGKYSPKKLDELARLLVQLNEEIDFRPEPEPTPEECQQMIREIRALLAKDHGPYGMERKIRRIVNGG